MLQIILSDTALKLQKVKHWHPKKESSHIRQAIAVRLNEIAHQEAKNKL